MERKTEVLLWKGELLLWKCRRELYIQRVEDLKRKSVRERDEAKRAERNFLAKVFGNYEEKLGKEKSEAVKAELKLAEVERLLMDAEKRMPVLEMKLAEGPFLQTEDFEGTEKELFDWCEWMEGMVGVLMLLNQCLLEGEAARCAAYSGSGDREKNLQFQENIDLFMLEAEQVLSVIGRVRYLPGMRMKTIHGIKRNLTMNGKTLLFFQKGYPSVEIDIMDFDLREKYGSWAVGDTLERKLKELRELESLFHGIAKEKLQEGEVLFGKVGLYTEGNRNIFGFETGK